MLDSIKGMKVLVTGGSGGIGSGIAKHLASLGALVGVTYSSNKEAAESTVESIIQSTECKDHFCHPLNISEPDSVKSCFDFLMERWGGLDGLVNNAGITRDQILLRLKTEDFLNVLNTNLVGTFLCTKQAVKIMLKAKKGGAIVSITSVVGQSGNAGQSNYAASKAGIEAFTKSIAQEVGSRSIRINCVAPGFIATQMTAQLSDQQKDSILGQVPLKSLGDVNDVAYATEFLLSPKSNYITGHTLNVNGGLYM